MCKCVFSISYVDCFTPKHHTCTYVCSYMQYCFLLCSYEHKRAEGNFLLFFISGVSPGKRGEVWSFLIQQYQDSHPSHPLPPSHPNSLSELCQRKTDFENAIHMDLGETWLQNCSCGRMWVVGEPSKWFNKFQYSYLGSQYNGYMPMM